MQHFCADELQALLSAIPYLNLLATKFHAWWHAKRCPHGNTVKHNPDPVRYFTAVAVERSKRDGTGDITAPGWYWFDETWAFCHGPYETEDLARRDLDWYVRTELNGESPLDEPKSDHSTWDADDKTHYVDGGIS